MTDDTLDPREALAADYVLGTLEASERRRAQALIESDPAFSALVDRWSRRLDPLTEIVAPTTPPPRIWTQLEAALDRRDPKQTAARPPLLERLSFWRWSAVGAACAAAALALYIGLAPRLDTPPAPGRYVAVLNAGAEQPALLATLDLETAQLTVRPLVDVAVADQDLELWLVSSDGSAPRSLGLLHGPTQLPLSTVGRQAFAQPAVLAISVEPAGGSPTGQPTGPVIYQGRLLALDE